MNTDKAWEKWGQQDPYYGVLTDPRFRINNLTSEAKNEFFATGEADIQRVFKIIEKFICPNFTPKNALDFGCGTGRLIIPLAKLVPQLVGIDISDAMLQEAKQNCQVRNIQNITFYKSDDKLSALQTYKFDFIHTFIVLQHIHEERVRIIFEHLLNLLNVGGIGAIQLSYAKTEFKDSYGIMPDSLIRKNRNYFRRSKKKIRSLFPLSKDPEMQMNNHNLNHLFFLMQRAGVQNFYTEFTDHGGSLGVFLYFQK